MNPFYIPERMSMGGVSVGTLLSYLSMGSFVPLYSVPGAWVHFTC